MNRRSAGYVLAFGFTSWASPVALAQSQDEGQPRALEEVVVTAQKRSESLQNVPISISVVTAQDISNINAFQFTELAQLTPGVDLFPGLSSAAIRIRGVGPGYYAVINPQSVAVFVDQVAQAQVGAVFSTLVDVERLELLRGPQGTLYGQNAPAGAYNITTASPNFNGINGYAEYSYSQFDAQDLYTNDLRAAINIPLVKDRLAWRVAGVYSESQGYVRMMDPASPDPTTGGYDNRAGRSKLLWAVNDVMDLEWTVNYQDLLQHPPSRNFEGLVPGTGGSNPVPAIYNKFEDRRNYGNFASSVKGEIRDTSLHWRWDTGLFNLDVLGFYQEFDTLDQDNRQPYPGGREIFNIDGDYKITTFEARFSDTGDILDYVAGLYYFDRPFDVNLNLEIQGVLVQGPGKSSNEGSAAYANLNFHLAPKWDLSVGARYDQNSQSMQGNFEFLSFQADLNDSADFDHLSWSVKLRNYITDNMTAYLSLDHAYKQGGFNPLVTAAIPLASLNPYLTEATELMLTYDEETSDAIEIGFKGTFLDNHLRLSSAIFYQRYNDHQIPQPPNVAVLGDFSALFSEALSNAGEVVTKGVEFDITYLFASYWDVALRASYADPTIEDWQGRFCGEDDQVADQLYCPKGGGEPLNDLPRWNTNLQLGMDRPFIAAWDIYTRLNWTWQSGPADTRVTNAYADPKSLIGLTVGLRQNKTGLDMRAWVKNLLDTDLNQNPNEEENGDPTLPPAYSGNFNPGTEYGFTLRYNF